MEEAMAFLKVGNEDPLMEEAMAFLMDVAKDYSFVKVEFEVDNKMIVDCLNSDEKTRTNWGVMCISMTNETKWF